MEIIQTKISGVKIIQPLIHQDGRGNFYEAWQEQRYSQIIPCNFVQDNVSYSKRDVLRGLHLQVKHPQSQLVYVTFGEIFDVVVDMRPNSPSYLDYVTSKLSAENATQIFIPEGVAHGFCALSEQALVNYKCSDYYYPQDESGLRYDALDIPWPVDDPVVSSKDLALPASVSDYKKL